MILFTSEKMETMTVSELNDLIVSARKQLKTLSSSSDPFKAIKGQEHCKRALIVAAVQGHSVGFFGAHGCGKTMLAEAGLSIGVPVFEGHSCPCGNYMDPKLPCKCEPEDIEKHIKDVLLPVVGVCDLHLKCPPVPANELLSKRHGTTTSQAKKQLERAGELPNIDVFGPGGDLLLKQAISTLGLSAAQVDTVLSVSQSVAALCESDIINADHLCEAIQYRQLDRLTG